MEGAHKVPGCEFNLGIIFLPTPSKQVATKQNFEALRCKQQARGDEKFPFATIFKVNLHFSPLLRAIPKRKVFEEILFAFLTTRNFPSSHP